MIRLLIAARFAGEIPGKQIDSKKQRGMKHDRKMVWRYELDVRGDCCWHRYALHSLSVRINMVATVYGFYLFVLALMSLTNTWFRRWSLT